MAKDPAINWYFDNWAGGTKLMTRFLKGCYMDLLDAQFHNGPLSLDEVKAVLGGDFGQSWPSLQKKFSVNPLGLFFNERMEHEKLKKQKFSEKQFLNGSKGGRPKTQTKPKDNPDINPNESLYGIGIGTETGIEDFGKSENLFGDLIANEINNSIEYLHRVTQKQFSLSELQNFWEGFKIQYSKDFHPNRNEVIKHFRNWLKKENLNGHTNNPTGNKSNRDKQADASASVLAKLRNITGGV